MPGAYCSYALVLHRFEANELTHLRLTTDASGYRRNLCAVTTSHPASGIMSTREAKQVLGRRECAYKAGSPNHDVRSKDSQRLPCDSRVWPSAGAHSGAAQPSPAIVPGSFMILVFGR